MEARHQIRSPLELCKTDLNAEVTILARIFSSSLKNLKTVTVIIWDTLIVR